MATRASGPEFSENILEFNIIVLLSGKRRFRGNITRSPPRTSFGIGQVLLVVHVLKDIWALGKTDIIVCFEINAVSFTIHTVKNFEQNNLTSVQHVRSFT